MLGTAESDIFKNRQLDTIMNLRSMMEMSSNFIKEYLGIIKANLRENGFFCLYQ